MTAAESMLRNSERSSFNRCRQLHHWSYTDRIQPKLSSPPLRFGTLVHKALEAYYLPGLKRGPHPAITFTILYEAELEQTQLALPDWKDEDDVWHDHAQLGVMMLEGYVRTYEEEDKEYRILASEQTFQVPLAKYLPQGKRLVPPSPTIAVGTIDGVWQHRGTKRLVFKEFKTTKSIFTGHLVLDEQAGMYWTLGPPWLAKHGPPAAKKELTKTASPYDNFEGVLYTHLRKSAPDPHASTDEAGHLLNKDGSVSKRQPAPYFLRHLVFRDPTEREAILARILNDAREIGMVRAGKLAVKKTPSRFTCMGCPHLDMCELHEAGQDWQAFRDQLYEPWDPYEGHAEYGEDRPA